MSVVRTWRSLEVTSLSSSSCSNSILWWHPIPNRSKFPIGLNFWSTKATVLLRLPLTHLTCSSTHPVKMAKSPSPLIREDSNHNRTTCLAYTEIMVIRHGETEWNANGRLQGQLDVELNEAGKRQAVLVADRLSKEAKVSAVYSSDLKRALVTAQTIAASCGGLEVIEDADLRERHLGDLQGLVRDDAAKACPEAYQALISRSTSQEIPGGGESRDQLYQRSTSSLQRIAGKHRGERVVVVTHGGVIRTLYRRACPNKRAEGKVLNTSINVFHIYDGKKWTLKVWGDVSHLDQTEYLDSGFGGDRNSG